MREQISIADSVKKRAGKSFVRQARELHLYLGTFFAPAIVFFAFTGALQTFSWHEHRPGDNYQPPRWIRLLAQIHKKQTEVLPPPKPERPAIADGKGMGRAPGERTPTAIPTESVGTIALKWFVFAMALGLITETALGIYMAFKFNPGRRMVWMLLVLGTVFPIAFILL